MPEIAALVPVRNAEDDLPMFLATVRSVADYVIALDDGSTDNTGRILRSSPDVKLLLSNPVRETYAGWDDSANRTRLLEAAGGFEPAWIVCFDADEFVDEDDGRALRRFLLAGASPDHAYGVRVFRMIDDLDQHDKEGLWVYRIFAFRHGQALSSDRLHFEPVPIQIPPSAWKKTTVRLRHAASLTDLRRRERYRKYEEADPERQWQDSYENLLQPPRTLKSWIARPPDLPVLVDDCDEQQLTAFQ